MDKAEQIWAINEAIGAVLLVTELTCEKIQECAEALYAAGYRKLPEKPKVLSDEELKMAYIKWFGYEPVVPLAPGLAKALAQAQLEADIQHYEGEE